MTNNSNNIPFNLTSLPPNGGCGSENRFLGAGPVKQSCRSSRKMIRADKKTLYSTHDHHHRHLSYCLQPAQHSQQDQKPWDDQKAFISFSFRLGADGRLRIQPPAGRAAGCWPISNKLVRARLSDWNTNFSHFSFRVYVSFLDGYVACPAFYPFKKTIDNLPIRWATLNKNIHRHRRRLLSHNYWWNIKIRKGRYIKELNEIQEPVGRANWWSR